MSTGRGFSGQALIDQADVLLAIAAADMAELKKYGWSEAKHKELDKSALSERSESKGFASPSAPASRSTAARRRAFDSLRSLRPEREQTWGSALSERSESKGCGEPSRSPRTRSKACPTATRSWLGS
ncbi:MAG: hypothetical protein K8T20_04280, partial [Planctomycetes bacterium]|nr:hypothetical protein [Planctomycetota bacterium]